MANSNNFGALGRTESEEAVAPIRPDIADLSVDVLPNFAMEYDIMEGMKLASEAAFPITAGVVINDAIANVSVRARVVIAIFATETFMGIRATLVKIDGKAVVETDTYAGELSTEGRTGFELIVLK